MAPEENVAGKGSIFAPNLPTILQEEAKGTDWSSLRFPL